MDNSPQVIARRASSFGTAAAEYARYRPDYPLEGIRWLLAPLTELLPGTTGTRVSAPTAGTESVGLMTVPVVDENARIDVAPLLAAAVGRPLVLAVRDLSRNAWMADAVSSIVAERPDAVVVELGLPYRRIDELAARGVTVVATYGASRVCSLAAAEALTGRRGEA